MNTIPRTSGIYKWTCTPTGKIYIGSAVNIHRRYTQHISRLRNGKHVNCYLQNAWNKYGEGSFTFEVVELVLETFRLEREQYWLDKTRCYDRKKGFNTSPTAGSSLGGKYPEGRGRKWTLEQRQAMSEHRKRNPIPPEQRANITAALKGRKPSKATLDASFQVHAKHFVVTDPSGHEQVIFGLGRFCDEQGLSRRAMSQVASGAKRSHRGWTCRRVDSGSAGSD